MDKTGLKEKLKHIFAENGLDIPDKEEDCLLDLDSLQTIALIVSIENAFDIEIPDEFLSNEMLATFQDYYELLISL